MLNLNSRRVGVALLVAGFHVIAGWTLIKDNAAATIGQTPGALELLPIASAPTKQYRPLITVLKISTIFPISPTMPRIEEEQLSIPDTMAITIPNMGEQRPIRSAAEVVREISESDVGALAQWCERAFPQMEGMLKGGRPITFLVHVEQDGYLSEARIIQSSGEDRRDKTVEACILAHERLTPLLVDGHTVDSWQRIRWLSQQSQEQF